jgi:hypothetical protein
MGFIWLFVVIGYFHLRVIASKKIQKTLLPLWKYFIPLTQIRHAQEASQVPLLLLSTCPH